MPCGKGGGKRAENCSGTCAEVKMGAGRSRGVVVEEVGKEVTWICRSEIRVQGGIVARVTEKWANQVCSHLVRFLSCLWYGGRRYLKVAMAE